MKKTILIAHRGASGYLPEHSLAAKALAHAMGADYLEQDVVLSADGIPLVLHDIYLDTTTDVHRHFPKRSRSDGRYYAIDFTLAEIRRLNVHERSKSHPDKHEVAVYPERFPLADIPLKIPTLLEEIEFIAGLDHSRQCSTGLYIELKAPNFHLNEGMDIADRVLATLEHSTYAKRKEQIFLQCFDDATLRRLRFEFNTPLPLIQLIADNSWGEDSKVDYNWLQSTQGLRHIATYADGIGPWLQQIYLGRSDNGKFQLNPLVEQAQTLGLLVHPYTFRRDELPPGINSFDELLNLFICQLGIDGLFTDFPDLVRHFIDTRQS
ncbi:MAG: glycerophosphodiester phosphodiesterase [Parahaliea sp.]